MCRLLGVLKSAVTPVRPEVMETLASAVNFALCCKKILKIVSQVSKLCLKAVSLSDSSRRLSLKSLSQQKQCQRHTLYPILMNTSAR